MAVGELTVKVDEELLYRCINECIRNNLIDLTKPNKPKWSDDYNINDDACNGDPAMQLYIIANSLPRVINEVCKAEGMSQEDLTMFTENILLDAKEKILGYSTNLNDGISIEKDTPQE